jgi:hypothetical protein
VTKRAPLVELPVCVFCGSGPTTEEDIWPQWVSRALLPQGQEFEHDLSEEDATLEKWSAPGFDVRAKVVCEKCNSGWMSRLETRAKKLLLPLMLGESRTLDRGDQMTAAVWVAKTVMMFELIHPPSAGIPRGQYGELFRDHTRPPARTAVWLGRLDPEEAHRAFYKHRALRPPGVPGLIVGNKAYAASFTVGQLVLLAFGHAVDEYVAVEDEEPGLVRVFPQERGVAVWPPPEVFSLRGFLSITDAFVG